MDKKRAFFISAALICFTGMALFLAFNRHSKSGYFNYHSNIWADRAGYFVYLPAALKYDFNPSNFPDSSDFKTGEGFRLDYQNQKVITKYTYGIALLQMPFFLSAELLAKPLGFADDGFSPIYHWSIHVASVIYLVLGIFFLARYLKNHFPPKVVVYTMITIFLATNLYYYSIDETGMSHIYSFFLFSTLLFLLGRTRWLVETGKFGLLFFGMMCGLIIVIRPSNIIFLSAVLFLDAGSFSTIIKRLKRLIRPMTIVMMGAGIFLMIIPQLFYWKYLSDDFFYYSYGSEGFNWTNPKIPELLISPDNGLLLYTPFFLFILYTMVMLVEKNKFDGWYFITLFLVLVYVFSSWYEWNFGCSFGARGFVEYLALFSIPVASQINRIQQASKIKKLLIAFVILLCIAFNLKMTYSYDGCFQGLTTWDWSAYGKHVVAAPK